MRVIVSIAAALGISVLATSGVAGEWPERPVTLIVPYGAGGATDRIARLAADRLSTEYGQPVIVENKPGAGGSLGTMLAANAENDGYTLLFANNSTHVIQPLINPNLQYDPVADFEPVASLTDASVFVGTSKGLGFENLGDLVDHLRETEGTTYGSTGIGSMAQFTTLLFLDAVKGQGKHIPYNDTNEAMAAVMSGEIDMLMAPNILQQYGQDTLDVLAVLSAERHPKAPDVPTAAEAGFDVEVVGWFGVFVPDGTPDDIVQKLSASMEQVVADAQFRETALLTGLFPKYRDNATLRQTIQDHSKLFRNIGESAGIELQ
ncbi:tripartite tricarboxylate transporter substrate binding protein [Sulfitobacter sp. PR48]|uniref:Bug family tripartite tricarboxylate transporter substrate binding protein n=1 Tax=Sulfitobacter sp. PR48 TaxID=3028383 RepID=UPI00237A1BE9|nr:tripartite tricarboxylate transporter substrate binding protein [Sulfitobacter sp. PR48]MDD9720859.1 tripartite tricarboxylate transporter substrate binding protein [Sulfitobacter sp. PR48]